MVIRGYWCSDWVFGKKTVTDALIRRAERQDQIREDAKFADEQKRIELLRKLIGTVVPEVEYGLSQGWVLVGEGKTPEEALTRRRKLIAEVDAVKPYFSDGDLALPGLYGLRNMVGADPERYSQSGINVWNWFNQFKDQLMSALREMEKLSKE